LKCLLKISVFKRIFSLQGSVFFELELHTLPQCPSFANLRLDLSEITLIYRMSSYFSESYKTIWMFWCRNVLNVFLPFSLLLLLNTATVSNLNKHPRDFLIQASAEISQNEREIFIMLLFIIFFNSGPDTSAKFKKRDATRTLAALVTVYLLTNTLNLILTIMEFINPELLRDLADGRIYKYLADLSSLLTISSTAARLPIYFHCNHEIRKQLRHFFHECKVGKQISML
uniref:G_PROTEIN_RECEP_F1_2 domain-containing protein n=1 Tax=Angiostrongylus cantonensis TaxID=6313 RepID=A0A0K0DPS7_ANGCA